jgi:hypothetical protein
MTPNNYGGLIWTNHALTRLRERQFSQQTATTCYTSPDYTKPGKQPGTTEYQKRLGAKTITLIISKNRTGEKVVVSAWIDPPAEGTKDYRHRQNYLEYQKASSLKKIWLIIKEQLGF